MTRRPPVPGERDVAALAVQLARSLRQGTTPVEALAEVARRPGPLSDDLARVDSALRRGVPFDTAIGGLGEPSTPGTDLLVRAVHLGQATGGDLAGALEGVAMVLLDRAELSEETRALTSQARASVWVLCALPLIGGVLFAIVEPSMAAVLLTTPLGWGCLVVAGVLDLTGLRVSGALVSRALGPEPSR